MDLRTYLEDLDKAGELRRIEEEIDPRYISPILAKSRQAVYFGNLKGYEVPAVGGLLNTMERLAIGMGVPKDRVGRAVLHAVENPIPPVKVGSGPVQEVVIEGGDVDLTRFPLPVIGERDGGPYISSGIVIATDPEYGRNVGVYRLMFDGVNSLGIGIVSVSDLRFIYQRALDRKEKVECAIVVGVHPRDMVAAGYKAPPGVDELGINGALRGRPVELVRCRTIAEWVPAHAEMVLECEIPPMGFTVDEGRFGEFTGFMGALVRMPTVRVKAITHRRNPIFHITHMPRENVLIDVAVFEASAWTVLQAAGVEAKAVNVTTGGAGQFHVVASVKKRPGEGKNALLALLSSALFKYAVVVDEDIDVFDPEQVEWAIFSRVQADRDVVIVSNCRAKPLDPSLRREEGRLPTTAKLGIDATTPEDVPKERYVTITYPFMGEVELDDLSSLRGKGSSGGRSLEAIKADILKMVQERPTFYAEILRRLPDDYRDIMLAFGQIRQQRILRRDAEGHYLPPP